MKKLYKAKFMFSLKPQKLMTSAITDFIKKVISFFSSANLWRLLNKFVKIM
jgi:hypothetical protein